MAGSEEKVGKLFARLETETKDNKSLGKQSVSPPSSRKNGACCLSCHRLEFFVFTVSQKYSAASLCSITTEVLKVLNATEDLIGEAGGESHTPSESMSASPISNSSETRRLDQRLTKMEENVYLAAGAVYGLEGALGDLEQCARSIETLKTAGLNVTVCNHFSKIKPKAKPQTLDSSRHQRRKLPAPPLREKLEPELQDNKSLRATSEPQGRGPVSSSALTQCPPPAAGQAEANTCP
ncbi:hypothetical protein FQN60_013807, partial [Etheostoma spectabile]